MNEDILKFIKENRIAVLSVLRPHGSVHGASLHYSNDREAQEFYFATHKTSRKAEGLVNGESVKASVVIGFKEEEMITLQMDGEVASIADEAEISRVKEIHYAKHPFAKKFEGDPNTMFIKFKPTWWRYSAFKDSPPVFIESDYS